MEHASVKLLESATHRTLHAHCFSRSSTQASLMLTDLLSRYLALMSATCAKYAVHAGRTGISVYDALGALDELGVSMEELGEYAGGEGKELAKYAVWTGRRTEDLNEFKAQLNDGLRTDRDDAIPLVYAPYHDLLNEESAAEEEQDQEEEDITQDPGKAALNAIVIDGAPTPPRAATPPRISTPALPLSPISNPPSPSHHPRKRPRKESWQPPEHIPGFLPPFPPIVPTDAPDSPQPTQLTFELPPPPVPLAPVTEPVKVENPQTTTSSTTALTTSTSASDYLVRVPYSQSSLAQVPEWHMPSAPRKEQASLAPRIQRLPTPQTEPALLAAYHHILTHPPPPNGIHPSLSRHRVAMTLLGQTQTVQRWDPADTLYGSVGPCSPRVASTGPTYALVAGNEGRERDGKEFKFPPTLPRAVAPTERITPLVSQQGSRIPDLARAVLPPTILSRTSRLTHPPPLQRGPKLLVYGGGVAAPWNANALPAPDAVSGMPGLGPKGVKEETVKAALPDARLYATWECETKDFRVPVAVPRTRVRGKSWVK